MNNEKEAGFPQRRPASGLFPPESIQAHLKALLRQTGPGSFEAEHNSKKVSGAFFNCAHEAT